MIQLKAQISKKRAIDMAESNAQLKEQQRISELERQIKVQKQKLSKKLTRQKILVGAFVSKMLDEKSLPEFNEYFLKNFPDSLDRKTDRELLKPFIESLGGSIIIDKPKPVKNKIIDNSSKSDSVETNNHQTDYNNQ